MEPSSNNLEKRYVNDLRRYAFVQSQIFNFKGLFKPFNLNFEEESETNGLEKLFSWAFIAWDKFTSIAAIKNALYWISLIWFAKNEAME